MSLSLMRTLLGGYRRIAPTNRGVYRLARLARRFIPRDRRRGVFEIADVGKLHLDLADYPDCCMAFGLYEMGVGRLIRTLLQPGDHFVDGGANVGYFTLMAARRVGDSGRVDALEPMPDNLRRLQQNLALNAMTGFVRVHKVALSDHAGEATIGLPARAGSNHGCASLFASSRDASQAPDDAGLPETPGDADAPANHKLAATTVATARLDQVLPDQAPTLIKLDIEGAETAALAGMTPLLQAPKPPALIVEYNTVTAQEAGVAPAQWIDDLLTVQPRYQLATIGLRPRPLNKDLRGLHGVSEVNILAMCN